MTDVELIAALRAATYLIPLLLLLRGVQWPWLITCIMVLIFANIFTAFGGDRFTTQLIGFAFQAALIMHVLDLSGYKRPADEKD
jgi:hypothetical protein